jgi:hypothetical protein
MNRFLVIIGTVLIVAGLLWPWLKKTSLFHLPGDIVVDRRGFKFLFSDHDNADCERRAFDHCMADAALGIARPVYPIF